MAIVLGIDPGSRSTGYGVINVIGAKREYITSGHIKLSDLDMPSRLGGIYRGVDEIIEAYAPQEFAIEKIFMATNADAALKLGQARGVAMVVAVNHQLPVFEYSAKQVKQAVVGQGAAAKNQVQYMVAHILKLPGLPQADAADALAIALTHANIHASQLLVASSARRIKQRLANISPGLN